MELLHGAPADMTGRSDREIRTYEFLDRLGIAYDRTDHPDRPATTMEVCAEVDAILVNFSGSAEALCRIAAGLDEPSGLLPMQMPKDMDAVERHLEDVPRDLDCYTDTEGHRYDFAYGMNYAGVIDDERVRRYSAPPLTRVENDPAKA